MLGERKPLEFEFLPWVEGVLFGQTSRAELGRQGSNSIKISQTIQQEKSKKMIALSCYHHEFHSA